MSDLPSGTVAFLFTDIERSTRLWERDHAAMNFAVERHLVLLRDAVATHGGTVFKVVGDAVQAAFPTAAGAVAAAVEAQRALLAEPWPDAVGTLPVRMALHAGAAVPRDGDYLAAPLNRLSRLLGAGHGAQILLTHVVERLIAGALPPGVVLHPLGTHRLRDLDDPEAVFQVVASGLPDRFPPLRSLPLHPTNLPIPPTPLIGRQPELAAVLRLFRMPETRLVTLTGTGGTGKTRLALAIGAEALDEYPEGVFFVDLAPLHDPALVIPAVAGAIGAREIPGEPLRTTLVRALAARRLLLILDNCEQILGAATDIAALLAACPDLSMLATSREPLQIRAERDVPLQPLPLPVGESLPSLSELAEVSAVALFIERATETQPDFALTEENAVAVATICRRLDGLPLAIELAAARVNVLHPAALLARLEQRLPLLTGGRRDLPTRQRTMRDAIAWSYDLLEAEEQALFRRLAVFASGFTLKAAEAVAGPAGIAVALDGVTALVEQSLLRAVAGEADEPRYQMLETVREFGLERLQVAGEVDDARARHAAHFLARTDSLGSSPQVFRSRKRLAPINADRDNLRLALAWCDERDEVDGLLRLSAVLFGLDFAPGRFHESRGWLDRALERSQGSTSVSRAIVLTAYGTLALFQGDYALAATFVAENLALARELRDPLLIGHAMTTAGFVAYRRGAYTDATVLLTDAFEDLREIASGDPEARVAAGIALLLLGDTALAQKQFEPADRWYRAAKERFEDAEDDWRVSDARAGMGGVSLCTGDIARAAACYAEALSAAHAGGYTMVVASALLGLAGIAASDARPEAGARLLGAAQGMAKALGAPLYPRDQPVLTRAVATLTAGLETERLASAQEAGRALGREEMVAEALAVAAPHMSASG